MQNDVSLATNSDSNPRFPSAPVGLEPVWWKVRCKMQLVDVLKLGDGARKEHSKKKDRKKINAKARPEWQTRRECVNIEASSGEGKGQKGREERKKQRSEWEETSAKVVNKKYEQSPDEDPTSTVRAASALSQRQEVNLSFHGRRGDAWFGLPCSS